MKRMIALLLSLVLLIGVLPAALADGGPADYGWSTDEASGGQDFSGWTAGSSEVSGDYAATHGNHRIWKSLFSNQATFTVELTVSGSKSASAYVRVMGTTLELDGRGGTGEQVYVKINGSGTDIDWLDAKNCKVFVKIERENGGALNYTLSGDGFDGEETLSAPAPELNENLELGLYAGAASFTDIRVTCGSGTATAPVWPVSETEGIFCFNASTGWNVQNSGWTYGQNETEGLWVQSSSDDGSSAQAAYIAEKLGGSWYANVQITPISTANGGRAVCKVQLLDQYKNPKIIFTQERLMSSQQVKFTLQSINPATDDWVTLWTLPEWTKLNDTSFNVRFETAGDGQLKMSLRGSDGYEKDVNAALPSGVSDILCYCGVLTEKTTARFSDFFVGSAGERYDYAALAREAIANLQAHFLDEKNLRLVPVVFGYPDGTVTNTGKYIGVGGAGAMWESAILLMALDTCAQNESITEEERTALAKVIANTVKMFADGYSEAQITGAGTGPINWCMDDCGWNCMALLLGYRWQTYLGNEAEAARDLALAEKLFDSSYSVFYDDQLGGGMWYQTAKTHKSLYGATLALAGYDLYQITGREASRTKYLNIYNGVENNLRRADGLYWMEINGDGIVGANNPYDISEGGSCTYLGGNMCMAVLNTRLGNLDRARQTALGMARYETDRTGAWLNDRDGWNNTFFAGLFVREVMNAGITDAATERTLLATVRQILKNACFDDGYYSASWQGPREPSSAGYPSGKNGEYYDGERNRWGTQNYENGTYIGSTPDQMMTSATTAHVLFAAAALIPAANRAELISLTADGSTVWPAANPQITSYELLSYRTDPVTLHIAAAEGSSVSVNGAAVSDGTVIADTPVVTILVTSADGSAVQTYTLRIREDACLHPQTETVGAKPATCLEPGYTGDTVCTSCHAVLSEGESLAALGHDYVGTESVPAGCISSGVMVLTCSRCGAGSSQIIPATGHSYSGGVCQSCGNRRHEFTDVADDAWYYGAVYDAADAGLMLGTSETEFSPLQPTSRAMIVAVLYRMDGSPAVDGTLKFTDTRAGKWYSDAVLWASQNEIVSGYPDGRFGTNDSITREQLVALMYRYAAYSGADVSASADLSAYPDNNRVSSYARENLAWGVAVGLISGKLKNGTAYLDPRGTATRAETASIFVRFAAFINNNNTTEE